MGGAKFPGNRWSILTIIGLTKSVCYRSSPARAGAQTRILDRRTREGNRMASRPAGITANRRSHASLELAMHHEIVPRKFHYGLGAMPLTSMRRSVTAIEPSRQWSLALFGRYLAFMALGNLLWEIAQLPLYIIWSSGTWRDLVIAVVHCTLGDVLVSAVCFVSAFLLSGGGGDQRARWIPTISIFLGVSYTAFSEWLNVSVLESWAYAPAMPVLPGIGTGLSPLLQWLVIPALGFWFVSRSRIAQANAKVADPSNKHLLCWFALGLSATLVIGWPHLSFAAS